MLLKRFYDDKLAQASYLIGCAAAGEAVVVDPNRDVEQYVRAAAAERLRITHVTETHIHADFVSGARELAHRTGATLHVSDEGDAAWKYDFAGEPDVVRLRDGDRIEVGRVRLEARHTPGHTPEHLSFLVTDTATADRPMGALTGDFVFVGDVGRPDLLERAARQAGTMEAGARTLFRALQRFKELPDWLQLWPGHGAGSACGKALGAVPQSTLGYERIFNWGLAETDEDRFVAQVLSGQPAPPPYFAEMKRVNKAGPRVLGGFPRPPRLPAARLAALRAAGALVVDVRPAADFAAGHVPGTINLPLGRSLTTWAGWLLPYDRPLHLLADDACPHCVDEAVRELAMIGLDDVGGWFGSDSLAGDGARPLESVPQTTPADAARRLQAGEVAMLDVRTREEYAAGHLPGVPNIPLGELPARLGEVPTGRPLVVHCQGGGRSAIAASILQAHGITDVANLEGGYGRWRGEGLPTTSPAPSGPASTPGTPAPVAPARR